MIDGQHMRACKRVGHVRAYAVAATTAHLVCLGEAPLSDGGPSICGEWPSEERWLGHSAQQELDVAKVLPLCLECAKAVRMPASM